MRLAILVAVLLAFPVTVAAGSPDRASGAAAANGALLIENAQGTVTIKGRGALVGHIDKGSLEITDLTPNDQWSPFVNGVPRGKVSWIRAQKLPVNFRIPKGSYRIVAKGEGISISAFGSGKITIDGAAGSDGDAGSYAVGDDAPQPLPMEPLKLSFGAPDTASSSG